MGDILSKMFNRFVDYPLKNKPCVFDAQNFSSSDLGDQSQTDYEKYADSFYKKLSEKRRELYENQSEYDNVLKTFQRWNETTVSYLHSLFLMFCNENKLLSYESFKCVLECLGDESPEDARKDCFSKTDKDVDGYINYLDFLSAIYNFHLPDKIDGLKRICVKVAENATLVTSLLLEKQLEYGLF